MRSALQVEDIGHASQPGCSAPMVTTPPCETPTGRPNDVDNYAEALSRIGPCGYGGIAHHLGWDATHAGQAETVLRLAGKLVYDNTGRARLREP